MKYLVFSPKQPGWLWTTITENGTTPDETLAYIVSRMRQGVFTKAGYDLHLVPKIDNPKKMDCTVLGKMLGITKSKFLRKNSSIDSKHYKRKFPEKTGVGTTLQTPLIGAGSGG